MKRSSVGRLVRRRERKLSGIGALTILFFVALIVSATLYGVAVNSHIDDVWQKHLEWLRQQNGR